ncbi:hypothetical protein [Bradyrhizobium sp.]|uniref:DUF3606 domain-containing protein n=1 Tax=Bradyrhizobium sp. TaxID=376 RepID=UPI002602E655|nr:hypothetical protein [Bradyrhizobium sp.]
MRRSKSQSFRNKLDLSDRVQVRLVRKRLRLSDSELAEIVERIGNSLSGISKQVALQRGKGLPQQADVPAAAVIAFATVAEQVSTEFTPGKPAS